MPDMMSGVIVNYKYTYRSHCEVLNAHFKYDRDTNTP